MPIKSCKLHIERSTSRNEAKMKSKDSNNVNVTIDSGEQNGRARKTTKYSPVAQSSLAQRRHLMNRQLIICRLSVAYAAIGFILTIIEAELYARINEQVILISILITLIFHFL